MWDLNFGQGASHDLGPRIFLAHDFQDMDGKPGDFIVVEGHGHPLVDINVTPTIDKNLKQGLNLSNPINQNLTKVMVVVEIKPFNDIS